MDVDVAIVLDRSGSMAYAATERAEWPPNPAAAPPGWKFGDRVPPNSRWLDACAAVDVFLEELSKSPTEEMVSLTTYSSTAVTDCPFTHDYAAIQQAMNGYSAAFRSGATNIASGIDAGCNSFANGASRNWASKVIIALTDGIHVSGYCAVPAHSDSAIAAMRPRNRNQTRENTSQPPAATNRPRRRPLWDARRRGRGRGREILTAGQETNHYRYRTPEPKSHTP